MKIGDQNVKTSVTQVQGEAERIERLWSSVGQPETGVESSQEGEGTAQVQHFSIMIRIRTSATFCQILNSLLMIKF